MIRIKILDEARMQGDNLQNHHIKHVLSTADKRQLRMDDMTDEEYNDLTDLLTSSSCGDVDSKDSVVGYVSVNNGKKRYNKYDKNSELFSVYDGESDIAISTYKAPQKKLDDAIAGRLDDKMNYVENLPDEEKKGSKFSYFSFLNSHPDIIDRSTLNSIVDNLMSFGILLPSEKMEKILQTIFSTSADGLKKDKFKIKDDLFVPMYAPSKDGTDCLKIDNREDNKEHKVDNLSLLISRFTGKTESVFFTHVYDEDDAKAVMVKVPNDSEIKKFTDAETFVLVLAYKKGFKKASMDQSKFKQLEIDGVQTWARIQGTLGYKLKSGQETKTTVK